MVARVLIPNLVIIRGKDVEGVKTFIEVPYLAEKLVKVATPFKVPETDDLNTLSYDNLALARTTSTGADILEVYRLNDVSTSAPMLLKSLSFEELEPIVTELVKLYNSSLAKV